MDKKSLSIAINGGISALNYRTFIFPFPYLQKAPRILNRYRFPLRKSAAIDLVSF